MRLTSRARTRLDFRNSTQFNWTRSTSERQLRNVNFENVNFQLLNARSVNTPQRQHSSARRGVVVYLSLAKSPELRRAGRQPRINKHSADRKNLLRCAMSHQDLATLHAEDGCSYD